MARRDQIIAVSPFGRPDPRLVAAACAAGALGVLDLGHEPAAATRGLQLTARLVTSAFGARITRPDLVDPGTLARCHGKIDTLVLAGEALAGAGAGGGLDGLLAAVPGACVLAEVTSLDEARAAVAAGADGLLARGNEAGGRVGELSSFALLQQLLGAFDTPGVDGRVVPVWCWGGMGTHTAVAAVTGGAAGVVLDTQLGLLHEATTLGSVAAAIRRLDGTETVVAAGHRVYQSPAGRKADGSAEDWPAGQVAARIGQEHPARQLLPLGQDVFLARGFAARYGTVARVVHAIRSALGTAREPEPAAAAAALLSAASPLCLAWGTTRPVAQGPMTRVSDQPAFARGVAEDGALPFLALALADGQRSRQLLTETRDVLGDHPWGVGLLGFAPDEVRAAQLEVVREIRPSRVIVAGGRPSQAAELEQEGIPTLLHVPSPTLLRQYLGEGCRRFVFEGSECGGHVGPRASFPLWEAQIAVLLEHLDAAGGEPAAAASSAGEARPGEGLEVLFAGGVHDARSAAMVAAMASPLAARGVGVGLLMGTAYLFTEEAVRLGAIQDEFQRQALGAVGTALLQTGPGHVTRCVTSPFVERFHAARDDLRAQGMPDRQAWEKLEQLNIGRLRVASKGVERDGDDLRPVDRERQRAEGLFMAGQAAVLRSATTTLAELHDSVTEGARRFLLDRADGTGQASDAAGTRAGAGAEPLDVAVIGMACVLPGAPDLATFWANVVAGEDAISLVPADRWDVETYYQADGAAAPSGDRASSKWGGFLPRVPFDPLRYGIPPAALASIEPVQVLALETARRALQDARLDSRGVDHERTGVVFGTETNSDLSAALTLRALLPSYYGEVPPELDGVLPRVTSETFTGILSNIIASRVSNRLDLGGPAYVVDAACASSLTALDAACRELRSGGADLMLCGGADLHNGVFDYLMFSSVGALSPTGRARPFAADADGTTLGEGVACVVLKRLADAERDGDRVYAVIKAVGSASDGRSLGLTAPRADGQRRALDRAYRAAGVSAADVGLVEAHGTGTVLGDRTELETLTRVFGEAGAAAGSCALGSVKSQIGHTKTAAGLAALVKTSLALHHGVLPPTLHVDEPNPAWEQDTSPFVLSGVARPWSPPARERVAGVSAFGFGGVNYHVVLTGHTGAVDGRHSLDQWPAELLVFRGADRAAALAAVSELRELLRANDAASRPWPLRDFAATAARQAQARRGPVQAAVVARDLDDLARLLDRAAEGAADPGAGLFLAEQPSSAGQGHAPDGSVALLFPGQGSQRPGMLAELFVAFPEIRDYLRLGEAWQDAIFPPAAPDGTSARRAGEARAAQDRLRDTRVAQPALGIAGLGMHHLLSRLGLEPGMTAGHSYGELVALCAAGAYDAETLLALSAARGEAIISALPEGDGAQQPDQGAMAAVRAPEAAVAAVLASASLGGQVVVANHNAPDQVVVSGPTAAVEAAVGLLRAAGHGAARLPVACAFHSPLVADAADVFARALARADLTAPAMPVWSNRGAVPYPAPADDVAGDTVRKELAAQIAAPVRFVDQIEAMYAAGARVFVEAGPGQVLTGLVGSILAERPHLAVACDGRRGGLTGFLDAIAQLAVAGVCPHTDWLVDGRAAMDRSGSTPPARPGWSVDGRSIRLADGEPLPGGLLPARRLDPASSAAVAPRALAGQRPADRAKFPDHLTPASVGDGVARETLVSQFLRTSRDNLAAQRDVLLAYLGAPPSVEPAAAPVPAAAKWSAEPAVQTPPTAETYHSARVPPDDTPGALAGATAPMDASSGIGTGMDVTAAVLELIAQDTGYPVEMIEVDLDLETDLSVNSLKRTELAGRLAERFAGARGGVDELSRLRTVRGIVHWLTEHGAVATMPDPNGAPSPPRASVTAASTPGRRRGRGPTRFVPSWRPVPFAPGRADLTGTCWVVFGHGPDVPEGQLVARRLAELGADVRTWSTGDLADAGPLAVDGAVYLAGWDDDTGAPELPATFGAVRAVVGERLRWLLAVTPVNEPRTAGLRGLFRSLGREHPATAVRLVEIGAAAWPVLADIVTGELGEPARQDEAVVRHGATRQAEHLVETPLGPLATTGAGPADDGAAEAAALGLDHDSVVVLVGGARGITAGFTTLLAGAARCHLELAGRTPMPTGEESPRLAAARDQPAVLDALLELGQPTPREANRAARQILAQREIRATLADAAACGGQARYQQLDVLDPETVHQFVKQVFARHGRIDAVVYSAGVLEDRLVVDKEPESFRRVFDTKVAGARALLAAFDQLPDRPRTVIFFGSIAGVLGNRGQSDYAAANDALERIGSDWGRRTGSRVLTVHWGPWAPDDGHPGMVSAELERDLTRRGVDLIDPEAGQRSLLRELAWGPHDLPGVVYTASGW
ncbi:SDR family oxidoreductase [Frankia sp. CN7]|nr:SDR family oxidoreductase [Frankia nepalensis]MBL7515869.1 SDR family oxidoreductase [Frankia nepalensis]